MTIVLFLGTVCGGFPSGLLKKVSTTTIVYSAQFIRLLVLAGFLLGNFALVLLSTFFLSVTVGLINPRLQEMIFVLIDEEFIGTVQSGISTFSTFFPSLCSICVVGIATSFGLFFGVLPLFIVILFSILLIKRS